VTRAPTICARLGCGRLAVRRGLCREHAQRAAGGKWRAVRDQVRARARGRCEHCGDLAKLQVHHVVPVGIGGEELPDLDALVALCPACHAKEHR
jgi:5-methylcytosine-specific restriction endonuclease McrA